MAEPAVAPNSTTTASGTFGGVEAPCWCDLPACNHTLEPLHPQGAMPSVAHGITSGGPNAGQSKGGGQ